MSPTKRFLLTLGLASMWSPSFLFIKFAIQDLPPLTMATTRITLAAIALMAILLWKGNWFSKSPIFWLHATLMGLFSMGFPFFLFSYAEQTIDSSLAAMINGTTPMFTALMAHMFIPSDRLTVPKVIGIALCAGGLFYLFAPTIYQGVNGTVEGMLAATGASISYGVGHIYGKKYFTGHKPFVAPASALVTAAACLWPVMLWHDQPFSLPMPSMQAIGGVCGLALFGTVFAFIIYYKLLETSGPTAISLVACFFPIGGMLLGMVVLGEVFTLNGLVAACLIILGMMIVNGVLPLTFAKTSSETVD